MYIQKSFTKFSKISKDLLVNTQKRTFSGLPLGEKGNFGINLQTVTPTNPITKFTELKNGVKVATVDDPSNLGASVGVYIKSGTRNETNETLGASFYLKRMGFQSTNSRTSLRLARELENNGASYRVASGREHTMYASEFPADKFDTIAPILSDVVKPALLDWEVRDEIPEIQKETHDLESCPRTVLFELLHSEAYRNTGLGQPLLPPSYNLHNLDADVLLQHVSKNYTSNRIVLVGAGNVSHETLVNLGNTYFGSVDTKLYDSDDKSVENQSTTQEKQQPQSKYVGGDVRIAAEGDTHLAVAFEGVSSGHKDAHAYATLQFLLGGGNSSFKEFIGNGATSNLFRSVSEKSHFVKEISAFNVNYSDSGLFGVYAVAESGNGAKLVNSITSGIKSILANITDESLKAAKTRYRSDIYFNNETRSNLMEFIAQQALSTGKVQSVEEYSKQVDSVTVDDVKRIAKSILSQNPTLVALGDITNIPSTKDIQKQFSS